MKWRLRYRAQEGKSVLWPASIIMQIRIRDPKNVHTDPDLRGKHKIRKITHTNIQLNLLK